MDHIRELLAASEKLTDSDRDILVKLLWLYGQVSIEQQNVAAKRINAYLNHDQTNWDDFMREVRTVVLDLEVAVATMSRDS